MLYFVRPNGGTAYLDKADGWVVNNLSVPSKTTREGNGRTAGPTQLSLIGADTGYVAKACAV